MLLPSICCYSSILLRPCEARVRMSDPIQYGTPLPSNGFAVMGKKKKEIYSTKSGNWPNSAGVDHKLIQKIMTTISMIDASGY